MPTIKEEDLLNFQSEILFLLMGKNPLPNYVAAKLLTKKFDSGGKPVIYLIHSKDTQKYAENLVNVLNPDSKDQYFRCIPFEIDPWNYYDIERQVNSRVNSILEAESKSKLNPKIGLNYTGGTKAMSVHVYRAVKKGFKFGRFSYLDPNAKYMRFDETKENEGQNWIDLSAVDSKAFQLTKISLEQLLGLHGWNTFSEPIEKPGFSDNELKFENVENFKGKDKKFEAFILKNVMSLRNECSLESIFTNLEILNPYVKERQKYCEIDVVAIRGYQLFAISCTTTKTDFREIRDLIFPNCVEPVNRKKVKRIYQTIQDDGKHLLTHKLFEIALRASQLGGAEAKMGFISLANEEFTKNVEDKLKNDRIKVWGKSDLNNLKGKLRNWFNGD